MIALQPQHRLHNAFNGSVSGCLVCAPLENHCCQVLTFMVSAVCASTMAAALLATWAVEALALCGSALTPLRLAKPGLHQMQCAPTQAAAAATHAQVNAEVNTTLTAYLIMREPC